VLIAGEDNEMFMTRSQRQQNSAFNCTQ